MELHNEELNDLHSPPNIGQMIKPRRVRWAGHVARMGRRDVYTGFSFENPRETLGRPRRRWDGNI